MIGSDLLHHSISANPCSVRIGSLQRSARRLPRHIGFIPDGNRRWAVQQDLPKEQGYSWGIAPGLALFDACKALGVEEVSVYGFTQDNTRRSTEQTKGFRAACVAFALEIWSRRAALLVVGDEQSKQFPPERAAFRVRQGSGIKVNFFVNHDWEWDMAGMKNGELRSADVSRLDMVVRWGSGRRLSGFLPVLCRHLRAGRTVARLSARASGRCIGLVRSAGPHPGRLNSTCDRRSHPFGSSSQYPRAR